MIQNQDIFAEPVSLNFEGRDSYQTTFGGIVTILLYVCMFIYSFTKGKEMFLKTNWALTQ